MNHIIIGSGVIGRATGEFLEAHGESVFYNDIDKNIISKLKNDHKKIVTEITADYDMFWICTAEWHVERVVENITSVASYVIIRSTIPPNAISCLQRKHPSLVFAHIPEFLREKMALQDVFHHDRLVIGVSDPGFKKRLSDFFSMLMIPLVFCSPVESSLVKLVSNNWLSLQISFWNEIKCLCDRLDDVDPQLVSDTVTLDRRISNFGSNMIGRPFGGFCFPKDTRALLQVFKEQGLHSKMISAACLVNDQFKKQSEQVEVIV